jgi:hypothetical protein
MDNTPFSNVKFFIDKTSFIYITSFIDITSFTDITLFINKKRRILRHDKQRERHRV